MNKVKTIDFLDGYISEETKARLKLLSESHPEIREELLNKTKIGMMYTIYEKNQSKDYIDGVLDTLKFIGRYF